MSSQTFHRCRHCRGFYEAGADRCKWCSYQNRFDNRAGKPVLYANREIVRAIQMAEYEQLPEKIRSDPMGPPAANLNIRCACIHCGPDGHEFEAIEMRWIANERMWACPCTTCGGRGFQFDVHPVEPIWECAECKRWYKPQKFTSKYAKCPYCGSPHANGWYDDEDENGQPIAEDDYSELADLNDEELTQLGGDTDVMPPLFGKEFPPEFSPPFSPEPPPEFSSELSPELSPEFSPGFFHEIPSGISPGLFPRIVIGIAP